MEEKSQACFSNKKPPPSLFPVQLQSNAISQVLWEEGDCLMAPRLIRTPGLIFQALLYPPCTTVTVIDDIRPILPFLYLHGPSFLLHPPAQILFFLQGQLKGHLKKACHIRSKPLSPCSETLYEFVK